MHTSHKNYPQSKLHNRKVIWTLLEVLVISIAVYCIIYFYINHFSLDKMFSYTYYALNKRRGYINPVKSNPNISFKSVRTTISNAENMFKVVPYKGIDNCYVGYSALKACNSTHGYPPYNISDDKFADAGLYMRLLKLDSLGKCSSSNGIEHNLHVSAFPTIVAALSSNHFKEALYLLTNIIHVVMPKTNTHLIIYDIGLTELENLHLRVFLHNMKCTTCFVRTFPFEMFPEHVKNIRGYTWKPLIISMSLKSYPYIMWVDTSVRVYPSIFKLFEKGRQCHVQLLQLQMSINAISVQTGKKTMSFLGLNESDYESRPMIQAGWGLYQRTHIVMERIIKPWVACALTFGCMVTETDNRTLPCDPPRDGGKFGWCHRFDQSILSILLSNVFPNYWSENTFSDGEYGTIQRM